MAASCKRVGCRVPATTTVVIDPPASRVALVDVELSPMGVTLCSVHASKVTPPMHWVLVDERHANLRLLPGRDSRPAEGTPPSAGAPAVVATPAPRRPRRKVVASLFS